MNQVDVKLEKVSWSGPQLFILYSINGNHFTNSIWYDHVDLVELSRVHGHAEMRNIYFHIAAFEINKLCSLKPDIVHWGEYSDLVTEDFRTLWKTIFKNVWAQWRYENDEPYYYGPEFDAAAPAALRAPDRIRRSAKQDKYLAFFAGGKDSLVASKALEHVGVAYDSLTYATSFYGTMESQFALVDDAAAYIAPDKRIRQWVFDDFLDSPVLELSNPRASRSLTAAETPSSIFGALPYVLANDLTHICLAHERSADKGQIYWETTGEDVNHQWGKSYEAEKLLNAYVGEHLIDGFSYFSILKPVYDIAIFNALRGFSAAAPATHSCNIRKPWCLRCPKCLYVWLGYAAFLDADTVRATFGRENLLDVAENEFTYRQLVGLSDRLPFECIGEADEAALLMKMAVRKGYGGCVADACAEALDRLDLDRTLERYLSVDSRETSLPPRHAGPILDWMEANAAEAEAHIRALLA